MAPQANEHRAYIPPIPIPRLVVNVVNVPQVFVANTIIAIRQPVLELENGSRIYLINAFGGNFVINEWSVGHRVKIIRLHPHHLNYMLYNNRYRVNNLQVGNYTTGNFIGENPNLVLIPNLIQINNDDHRIFFEDVAVTKRIHSFPNGRCRLYDGSLWNVRISGWNVDDVLVITRTNAADLGNHRYRISNQRIANDRRIANLVENNLQPNLRQRYFELVAA